METTIWRIQFKKVDNCKINKSNLSFDENEEFVTKDKSTKQINRLFSNDILQYSISNVNYLALKEKFVI